MTSLMTARKLEVPGRLRSIDLSIAAGQLVGVIGPNGGGKTSLLRALAVIEGSSELLEVDGTNLYSVPTAQRPHLLAFLPASRELVWPISVSDTVALGLPRPDKARLLATLDMLALTPLASRPVNQLSTGERSRVLLARALVAAPRLVLLDEPLANLDAYWALRTLEILRDIVGAGSSALVALHDLNQMDRFDRILLMNGGDVILDGSPSEISTSEVLQACFGVEQSEGRWRIRPQADLRSSR